MKKYIPLAAYIATIPAANWMIGNIGACIPNGPCLIDVGFGYHAPSGVLMVGAALVLRDLIHERLGPIVTMGAVLVGALVSLLIAAPALALASAAAFLLSELADMAVYSPLRKTRLYSAVVLSGLIGAVVDSAVFLFLAFGSLEFIAGQVLGKVWMTAAAIPIIWAIRTTERRSA